MVQPRLHPSQTRQPRRPHQLPKRQSPQQLKLTNDVQNRDNAIYQIGKKKRSFPLWQSAIVLLVMSIGWLAIKPHAPAPQNGEVRQAK